MKCLFHNVFQNNTVISALNEGIYDRRNYGCKCGDFTQVNPNTFQNILDWNSIYLIEIISLWELVEQKKKNSTERANKSNGETLE